MNIKFILLALPFMLASCEGIKDEDIATSKIELLTKLGEIDDSTDVKADTAIINTEKK